MTSKNVESLEVFIDGEKQIFERDLTKEPLSLVDAMYALQLTQKQALREERPAKTDKAVDDAVKQNVNDFGDFASKFFRNQFTKDQAVKGIKPGGITYLNELVMKSQGAEFEDDDDTKTAKK